MHNEQKKVEKMSSQNEGEELLAILDRTGKPIGIAKRKDAHGNPGLLHRVVHVLVFNKNGAVLLQKRSTNKDVAPGRWDTSVGGHVKPGEDMLTAALRELDEELGIKGCDLVFLYEYLFSSSYESELVSTFSCIYEGKVHINRSEIDEIAYWHIESVKKNIGASIFSDHFETEMSHFLRLRQA